jgi:hypothetical protein
LRTQSELYGGKAFLSLTAEGFARIRSVLGLPLGTKTGQEDWTPAPQRLPSSKTSFSRRRSTTRPSGWCGE